MLSYLMLGGVLFSVTNAGEFPSSITKCAAGDTDCLANVITKFIRTYSSGLPEIGLNSIDPLHFTNASVSQQSQGPLSMNISITSGDILGWKNMQVKRVIGFDKDPKTSKFELHVYVPLDTIIGTYDLSAQALLIPVKGQGSVNLTFEHLEMIVKFRTNVEPKNGEDYLMLKKINLQIDVQRMHSNFTNLFSDKELSDNTNSLLNQYQSQLFPEIRTSFATARAIILEDLLRPVLSAFPYRTFFTK